MKSKNKDLNTLIELNNFINSEENAIAVQDAKITSPSKAVEGAITDFITSRLTKVTNDADFEDIVKANIRQRLNEASFSELINLLHTISSDSNKSAEPVLNLFENVQSGKNIVDTLREANTASTAKKLYDSTEDKNILQAVTYLGQVMSQLNNLNKDNLVDVTPHK